MNLGKHVIGGPFFSDRVEIHPGFVEEAVFVALRGREEEAAYHKLREPIYREADPDVRERAFGRLNGECFDALDLGAPIRTALSEQKAAVSVLAAIAIVAARSISDEGAELFVDDAGRRRSIVMVHPSLLADHARAMTFFRRELMHVADMLDPAFAYEPRLPAHPLGPAHDGLARDRYRALWNTSIDGRLCLAGRLDAALARRERLREFLRPFACLRGATEACFERVFDGRVIGHRQFVALALDPVAASAGWMMSSLLPIGARRGRCPLCGFPTFDFVPAPEALAPSVQADIVSEFPEWRAQDGLCRQCADLYESRKTSSTG